MSQKVRIKRISFRGVPAYLGEHNGNSIYTGNPQRVSEWLCDGYRTRFNQHRSNRCKYVFEDEQQVLDDTGKPVLVPIGSSVVTISDKDSRQQFSHLAAMPSLVLQTTEKLENTEWFAAIKRRKANGGALPVFRSRKRGDRRFSCWFNGGRNAVFHQTGKRSGMVVFSGQNPPSAVRKGRWELRVHVTVSQPIRSYTSVHVDLAKNQVVFTSPAPVVDRSGASGSVGIDRGVVHSAATSDGEFFDLPDTTMVDRKIKSYQKKMSRSRLKAEAEGRDWKTASRYAEYRRIHRKLQAARAASKNDAMHKFTTRIARGYDISVVEELKPEAMSKSAKGTVEKPGKKVRQKAGLNRGIRDARWAAMLDQLRYKTGNTEEHPTVFTINPAYTSLRCTKCGHIASKNRESQSGFRCIECGHIGNADINAAINIVAKHKQEWTIPTLSKGKTGNPSGNQAPALKRKPPALTGS
jgi:putative transposase